MADLAEIREPSSGFSVDRHGRIQPIDQVSQDGVSVEIAFELRHLRELCEEWEKRRATGHGTKSADDVSIPVAQWDLPVPSLPEANSLYYSIERDARAIGRTLHVKGGVTLMRHVLDMAAINEPFRGAVSRWWTGIGYRADIWMK